MVWIVLDSVGIGALPDAGAYGDVGSDTLGNIALQRPLELPNLARLGLGNIGPVAGIPPADEPAAYGKCALASPGKDTTTGHWEMAGILLESPFPLYPGGFPDEIVAEFSARTGRGVLCNAPASGTEIIQRMGEEHLRTGKLIVYTSADSVFQIAAHEEIVPLDELYRACGIARQILQGPHEVGRVIARPFTGSPGAFVRTANRRDFAVPPPPGMLLDLLCASGAAVHGIGKIGDIFLGRGLATSVKTKGNQDGMRRTIEAIGAYADGLIFVNLVDFDQLYGHRNDVEGYAAALEAFDCWLPDLEAVLRPGDLVLLTADHGCDPTTPSTDHSREYVPLLAFGPGLRRGVDLGVRHTLADVGQTVAEVFDVRLLQGESFLGQLL